MPATWITVQFLRISPKCPAACRFFAESKPRGGGWTVLYPCGISRKSEICTGWLDGGELPLLPVNSKARTLFYRSSRVQTVLCLRKSSSRPVWWRNALPPIDFAPWPVAEAAPAPRSGGDRLWGYVIIDKTRFIFIYFSTLRSKGY